MHAKRPIVPAGILPLIFCLLLPLPASAQQAVGIVTGLQGRVDLTRQPSPTPVGLRLQDDLFLRDVIDTRQESVVRMLLGGQSTVTVRELTRLVIRAELLPTGGTRTIYDLADGKIRVNVAPKLMRPGDVIEIHTPNAVATIRGSGIIAEVIGNLSRFLQLSGIATITPQGQASSTLTPGLQVAISGTPQTGIQAQPPTPVTPAEAVQAQQGLEVGPAPAQTAEANRDQVAQQHVATATQLATAVVEAVTGAPLPPSPATTVTPVETGLATPGPNIAPLSPFDKCSREPTTCPIPVTPPVAQPPVVGDVPEVEIIGTTRALPPGETLKTFSGTSTRGGISPVVRIATSTVTQTGPNSLIEVEPGANATLAGPLATITNANLSTGGSVLSVRGTLTGTGTGPFIQTNPTTMSTGGFGSVTTFDESPPGFGPINGLTFKGVTYGFTVGGNPSADANFGSAGPGSITFVEDPSLEGDASGTLTLNFTNRISHLQFGLARSTPAALTPGSRVTLQAADGSVLGSFDLNTAPLETFSEGLFVYNGTPANTAVATFPSAGTAPRFALDNLAIFDGALISLEGSGARLSLAGSLLQASTLSLTSSAPLLSLSGGARLTTGGPLLDLQATTLNLPTLALLTGGSTLATTAGPVIRINGGSLTGHALAVSDGTGNAFNFTGSLLDLTNTSLTLRTLGQNPDTDVATFALAEGEPQIRMVSSAVTLTGAGESLVEFGTGTGTPITQTGVGLIATGTATAPSTINLAGPLLDLGGVNLIDPNPQVQLTNTTVTQTGADSLIEVFGLPVTMAGSLLTATDSSITVTADFLRVVNSGQLTGNGSDPLLQLTNTGVEASGNFVRVGDFDDSSMNVLSLSAPLLRATDSMLTSGDDFIAVLMSGTLVSTTPEPLIQLTNTPVTTLNTGSFNQGSSLLFVTSGDTVNLSGPLLNATNSDPERGLSLGGTIVTAVGGGELTSTSADPLIMLSGGTHRIGTTPLGTHSLFHLSGPTDPETGLGNTSPLRTGGELFRATGGAHVYVGGGAPSGNALRLDAALLDASAPIISLIGSATTQTSLTTGSSMMELIRSNVTTVGPVVALDRGIINVNDGPLINLTGSQMMVMGDLLSLTNGSRISVVNGPLIRVEGFSSTETASTLTVIGALVNFGGTGGNMIVVNNSITPDAALKSGLPVSTVTNGTIPGTITIGPNPIRGADLGSITVNGATVGVATSFTGSLIQATNGGVVNIAAPAQ